MRLGRAICGDLAAGESREWLLTNGRGGYALGTVAGTLTRRYHGLLIAATDPPVGRRLVVARLELEVDDGRRRYALSTNRWISGAIAPEGWRFVEAFFLDDGLPRWRYVLSETVIDVTLAMPHGVDAIAVAIDIVRAAGTLAVRGRLVAADRDHHGGALPPIEGFAAAIVPGGATVALPACGRTLHVRTAARCAAAAERYAGFSLPRETARGTQDADDYAHVLDLAWDGVVEGGRLGVVATLDPACGDDAQAIVAARRAAARARAATHPLAAAADAFVVDGAVTGGRTTIIAGYPWFTDWGRDTMIALPGLLLRTGRAADAGAVLRAFAAHVQDGLVPNRFPDAGGPAEYNTIDASLWYVEAVRAYVAATGDEATLRAVWDAVRAILVGYRAGTRFGIRVDDDGLVRGGEPGVQLTWMDAKVDDRVITPRHGKPIEISALWYNALRAVEVLGARIGEPSAGERADAQRTALGMQRFWNPARGCCFDVLDGPDGDDPSLRPNQIIAAALPAIAFDDEKVRAIVDACAAALWTPIGLRTLDPDDPRYRGVYGGDQAARDAAYHQGTVWPWLLAPFARAHLRAYGDPARTRGYVAPLRDALEFAALGSVPEIADGDPPHAPNGCPAQAWSVAALIEALECTGPPG